MSKIYLVVCDVFNSGLLDFQKTYLSFTDKDKAENYVQRIDEDYTKFSLWWESIEDICQNLNDSDILEYVEYQTVPREWKMQVGVYRISRPLYALSQNLVLSFPELKEIVLI